MSTTTTTSRSATVKPKRSRRRQPKQETFEFRSWGGPRKGAGRKPRGKKAGMPHDTRAALSRHHPVHVTIRLEKDLPSFRRQASDVRPPTSGLRRKPVSAMIRVAIHKMLGREGYRIVAYSIQTNHLHLIIEAQSRSDLAKGMRATPHEDSSIPTKQRDFSQKPPCTRDTNQIRVATAAEIAKPHNNNSLRQDPNTPSITSPR